MSLFIVFIVAAVLLGAGAMLSPAWRTAQPRVALAATLCLALVMGGAVFYAEAFGWDTLVVDYLLFALLSAVILGGTLSTAQARAEAQGQQLADRDQGWPGPGDLAFFALAAALIAVPLLHLEASPGAHGQIHGLHSLAARDSESFASLAPYAGTEAIVIAPGFQALSAYLSQQLGQPMPRVQLSLAGVVFLLLVWLCYDFGAELRCKASGRAMALAALLCPSLHHSYLDGRFSELLGLLFLMAFALYALRFLRRFNLADLLAGGLMLGAVVYSSLSLSLIALLGFASLCAIAPASQRARVKTLVGLTLGFPFVAALGIAPWLVNNLTLLLPVKPAPEPASLSQLALVIQAPGIAILPLALCGMVQGLGRQGSVRFVSTVMLAWLLLALEFSLVGAIGELLYPLGALIMAGSLARFGTLVPLLFFAGLGLQALWNDRATPARQARLRSAAIPLLTLAMLSLLLYAVAFAALLPLFGFPQPLQRDDLAAMTWLRDNSPADSMLLSAEGDAWLPVFAERKAAHFRAFGYFEWDLRQGLDEGADAADFVFAATGVDPPAELALNLVFQRGGARVYEILKG